VKYPVQQRSARVADTAGAAATATEDRTVDATGNVTEMPDAHDGWAAPGSQPAEGATAPSQRWQAWLALDVVAAVLVALLSLRLVVGDDLAVNGYGLPPALPITWYLALAVLVLSSVVVLSLPEFRSWLAALHVLGLIFVLYGTGVLLAGAPRFAWSYKHIGVTNYITQFGQVDPGIDIYHRWPGFFSLASMFGAVAGLPDAASYAAWAGVVFVALETMLVVAIARTQLGNTRSAWAAGLVFLSINWVGQDYFAPQPFAFVLALGVLWLSLLHFQSEPQGRLARIVARLFSWVSRSGGHGQLSPTAQPLWRQRTAVAVVTLLFVAIVPSHQLTPYIVILVLVAFAVVKGFRPRWFLFVLGALALLYLVPNFSYVQSHYDVFSGLDPFGNAAPVNDLAHVQPAKVLNVRAGQALSLVFALLAVVALVRAWRRRQVGVFHAALGFAAPFVILLTLRYGGEGSIRVILFAAPWAAVLIASSVVLRRAERNLLLLPVVVLLLALFLPAYYGVEQVNRIPRSEVTASEFLYTNGQTGAVVVGSAPNFPYRTGARYAELGGERSSSDPVLTRRDEFRKSTLGPADVDGVVNVIRRSSPRGYVVFSQSQETYAEVFGVSSVTALRSLEAAMVASGRFQVFYQNDTTRIYELVR
jgi:hypothetical protein